MQKKVYCGTCFLLLVTGTSPSGKWVGRPKRIYIRSGLVSFQGRNERTTSISILSVSASGTSTIRDVRLLAYAVGPVRREYSANIQGPIQKPICGADATYRCSPTAISRWLVVLFEARAFVLAGTKAKLITTHFNCDLVQSLRALAVPVLALFARFMAPSGIHLLHVAAALADLLCQCCRSSKRPLLLCFHFTIVSSNAD